MKIYTYNNINYEVSENGDIIKNGIALKQYDNGNGYHSISLSGKLHYVHRVVAIVYIENRANKPQVNHKNGVRNDNRVENLEWVTRSENLKHGYRVLKSNHGRPQLGRNGFMHHNSKPVSQIDKETNEIICIHGSIELAAKTMGVCSRAIWSAVNKTNRMKSCKGYKWEYYVTEYTNSYS